MAKNKHGAESCLAQSQENRPEITPAVQSGKQKPAACSNFVFSNEVYLHLLFKSGKKKKILVLFIKVWTIPISRNCE